MIEVYCKPVYHRFLIEVVTANKVVRRFSPNVVTFASLVSGVSVLLCLYQGRPVLATLLLLLSGYLDSLDGALARATKQSSAIGTVFDIMADRVVESSIVLGLFCVNPAARGLSCILMLASMLLCITSFLVVGVFTPNQTDKSFYYSPGLMERAEAFIFFLMMIWLPQYFTPLAILFSLLVCLTGLNRIREFARQQNNEVE